MSTKIANREIAFAALLSELAAVDLGSTDWAGYRRGALLLYDLIVGGLHIILRQCLVCVINLRRIKFLCRIFNLV